MKKLIAAIAVTACLISSAAFANRISLTISGIDQLPGCNHPQDCRVWVNTYGDFVGNPDESGYFTKDSITGPITKVAIDRPEDSTIYCKMPDGADKMTQFWFSIQQGKCLPD